MEYHITAEQMVMWILLRKSVCVHACVPIFQVLFIKWVLTMFDMIDAKDQLHSIYGFLFSFVTEENLVCVVMILLHCCNRQPFLMHLLSLYKVFCPELVTLSLPSRMKAGFRNHNSQWKSALIAVQKKNSFQVTSSVSLTVRLKDKTNPRKRKHNHLEVPALSSAVNTQTNPSSSRKLVPLVQLHSFSLLLENLHHIELPAQMGSLLGSSLALQYLDCVQDESAFLRLNFWLGHALHEEFLFCSSGVSQNSEEVLQFLDRLLSSQHFLQEGFSSTEAFLYKFLNIWDGSLLRPQILGMLSNIPVVPSSCEYCSPLPLLVCVHLSLSLLHVVSLYVSDGLDISLNRFKDSLMELVHFVGRLASVGLQIEGCHSLLLSFILDFYETVCDMFLKYGLPLVVMPPAGVFYPALFATDPVSVDRLAHIMYRYKVNLMSAKTQEKQTEQAFHISRQTYREFNHYLVVMVNCLWNSKMFQPGMGVEMEEELLVSSKVPQYWSSFDFIHHPAFLSYAVDFHHKCWPGSRNVDFNSIKHPKPWGWYLEYLYAQGFEGLKQFVQSNISRRSTAGDGQGDGLSADQR
uniref:Centromere protein I n=1 Tax=Myripristis murdjan TaxID=586833 RepID=A0A668A2W6_9TELE